MKRNDWLEVPPPPGDLARDPQAGRSLHARGSRQFLSNQCEKAAGRRCQRIANGDERAAQSLGYAWTLDGPLGKTPPPVVDP